MRTLLIDNYDSFTFNLFQLLAAVNREDPIVVRNDEATWAELQGLDFDNVVISPGPGRPEHPKDFGVCKDAIKAAEVPLLGVCLGHQGLAHFWGGAVVHAPEVMHGRLSAVFHDESPLYAGIPQGFEVVRYHSLCVAQPLPACFEVTSWTADAVVMGVAHRERPLWGVQFHPESICTNDGRQLVQNFRDLTEQVSGEAPTRLSRRSGAARSPLRPRTGRPKARSVPGASDSRSAGSSACTTRSASSAISSPRSRTPSGWTAARHPTPARGSPSWARAGAR